MRPAIVVARAEVAHHTIAPPWATSILREALELQNIVRDVNTFARHFARYDKATNADD